MVRLKANCVKVHFNIYQVDIKHITSHVASITRRQVDEKWCYVLLTVWHIRKRSFFFTREFALEQTCFLWFSRCACWVYGIIDWSASVLADLITCNFRSLSSSSCSANLGFMGNCRKSSSTSSKWSMRFPPFLGCSVWYFQAQTINTFSTLGCLHAVIQSLKMFELAFNHLSLLQVVAGVTSKKK